MIARPLNNPPIGQGSLVSGRAIDPDYVSPYSQQSNIGYAQQIGKNMALVVDGKVRGTPRIAGAVSGGYRIDGFNKADAERMAAAINNGCRH